MNIGELTRALDDAEQATRLDAPRLPVMVTVVAFLSTLFKKEEEDGNTKTFPGAQEGTGTDEEEEEEDGHLPGSTGRQAWHFQRQPKQD